MFNIPNILTMFRIGLVPVFVAAMIMPGQSARIAAFAIFCLAGISDALDGFAARKLKAGSDFGKMLDPIADKILVAVALMMLVADGVFDGYKLVPALIILSREILVSGLREFLAGLAVSVPVSRIAKLKTAIQMIAIGAMILRPLANGFVPGTPASAYSTFAYGALWLAAALTVYTGYIYFRAGLAHVRPARSTHGEPV
ncbi:MAG TPA: CDP-diacylglycerol--glycerol-3-phosphate 3-phosphatidyltransferase [Rhizomicrobium sp.]|nr:CDP-diacylglycerol--glycerol-3-phosphate 3-phosphatidyltransferase [Rhizomicrobium sp.]